MLDYGDLTHRPLLSPFDVGFTVAMYHEGRVRQSFLWQFTSEKFKIDNTKRIRDQEENAFGCLLSIDLNVLSNNVAVWS